MKLFAKAVSDERHVSQELETLRKLIVDLERTSKGGIKGNTFRSLNNAAKIAALEKRTTRLVGMVAAMYIYMQSSRGFNRKKFLGILKLVAKDQRILPAVSDQDIFE